MARTKSTATAYMKARAKFGTPGKRISPYIHIGPKVNDHASLPAGTFTPAQVCKAYGLSPVSVNNTVKLGIVSLGGAISQSDIATAMSTWGLPAPNVTVLSVRGATMVPDPQGADVEDALDLLLQAATWAYLTNTPAEIVFAIAPNDANGIADAFAALMQAGCGVASASWGSPESDWTASSRAYTENALSNCQNAGMWMTAASGDNSLDDGTNTPTCDYPAGSAFILACGGTTLTVGSNGLRLSEKAWGDGLPGDDGGGGGIDPNTPRPSWQVTPNNTTAFRGSPDVSANADPNTGWQIVADSSWLSVGGTSASSPFWSALLAVSRALMITHGVAVPNAIAPTVWSDAGSLMDIVLGSNGSAAIAGWDESSGLGTPTSNILSALSGTLSTQPNPPSPPSPPTPPASNYSLVIPQGLPACSFTIRQARKVYSVSVPVPIPPGTHPVS